MSIGFNDTEGEAKKTKIDYFKFEDGSNKFRLVGNVLPRYVYWKSTPDGEKQMNVECLAFNRETEKFDNLEKDWFKHYFKDEDPKCSWSYLMRAFDEKGNLVVVALKKKMFQAIKLLANKHLGDPTDPVNGWWVSVERVKTGPKRYNVSYEIDQLGCEKVALTEDQLKLLEEAPALEDLFPRQTPEEQKAFIEKIWFSTEEETTENEDDLDDMDDDIPV